MKRTLSILSLILIFNIAKANTIADTIPHTKVVNKAIPKPVWGKPKILHGKDSVARIKEETKSFRLVKKHYNAGKP